MIRTRHLFACWFAAAQAASAQLPPPPSNVRVTNGCTTIQLNWSPVLQATDYYIRRNTVNNQNTATTVACHQPNFYNDTNASPNVTYWYWVGSNNSISGCGNGPPGTGVSGMRLAIAVAPTGTTVSSGQCGSVVVSWNPVIGAEGYSVYRHTTSSSGSATRIATSVTSPYRDSTGDPGRTYFYWVTADNSCGSSPKGAGASGNSGPLPEVPGAVAASDGTSCTSITVTWSGAAHATSYRVYRNTSNSSSGRTMLGSPTASPWIDASAAARTTYFYWVQGANSCGLGSFSSAESGYLGTCGSVQAFGAGCGGPVLGASPAPGSRPVLGQTYQSEVRNVPGTAVMALGVSNAQMGSLVLPLSLSLLGMTGCQLLQSSELPGLPCVMTGPGTARHDLALPSSVALVGSRVYLQALALAPGQNPAGLIFSNGLSLTLGNL